jgi:hypothetical protein
MMRMCSSGKISAEGHCDIVLLSPPRVFLPINDQQTVPLEGTKTCLQGSQHRNRDIGGVTFLKRACNDIALAGDTVLAFCDEPISLG